MSKDLMVPEPQTGVESYRMSTDAATLTKEIVLRASKEISGRKYVMVEGWQAIAIAHGCTASSSDVTETLNGFKAIGKVIRMSDGMVLSSAEGFVGNDEETWKNRAEYAKRAMAQTRAISRACRSAFAHVVVMMNAGLSTTPAEEVGDEPDYKGTEKHAEHREAPPRHHDDQTPSRGATEPQLKAINALLGKLGVKTDDARHSAVAMIVGRKIASLKDLDKKEASKVIESLGNDVNKE